MQQLRRGEGPPPEHRLAAGADVRRVGDVAEGVDGAEVCLEERLEGDVPAQPGRVERVAPGVAVRRDPALQRGAAVARDVPRDGVDVDDGPEARFERGDERGVLGGARGRLVGVLGEVEELGRVLRARAPDDELVGVAVVVEARDDGEPRHADVVAVELRNDEVAVPRGGLGGRQQRRERAAVEATARAMAVVVVDLRDHPGEVEDGREEVDELRRELDARARFGDPRVRDDERDRGRRVVGGHLVELLPLHLHVAVVRGHDEDGGVVEQGVDVAAEHGVELGDHGVVDRSDLAPPARRVERADGLGVPQRGDAALAHRGLEVARVERRQRRPRGDADLGPVDLRAPVRVRRVRRMHDLVARVEEERPAFIVSRGRRPRDGLVGGVPVLLVDRRVPGGDRAVRGARRVGGLGVEAARCDEIEVEVDVLGERVEPDGLGVRAREPVGLAVREDVVPAREEDLVEPVCERRGEPLEVVPRAAHEERRLVIVRVIVRVT
mmetsp:Transcript_14211/g.56659  ORF Transcript_14211/g.56659 Transcript_14211/m.56659 type:complete len:496 (-) Transcript_14211:538-2025(-)